MHPTSLIPRFRLRTLLLFTFLCALALAMWPLIPTNRETNAMRLLESDTSLGVGFSDGSTQVLSSQKDRLPVTDVFIDLDGPPYSPIPSATAFTPLGDLWSLDSICIYDWGNRDMHIPPFPFHRGPTYLFLCECKLDRDTLDSIAENLPNLEKVDLYPNEHTEYSPGTFAKILSGRRLIDANLEQARLDAADLEAISKSKLKTLSLGQCTFDDRSFSFIAKSRIDTLYYGPEEEAESLSLIGLKQCRNLRRVWITSLSLNNACLDEIAELKDGSMLEEITLYLRFDGETHRRIQELKLLKPKDGMKITINDLNAAASNG